jgi:hypothetical protein
LYDFIRVASRVRKYYTKVEHFSKLFYLLPFIYC